MPESNRPQAPAAPSKPGLGDVLCLLLLTVVFVVISYFHSRNRMFWGDEIMGWLVLRAPNWHRLLYLWRAGIDSSGIWFYVLGRPWTAIFGASEMSLREFSAAGVAASAAVIWITARRYYSLLTVAGAVCFVYASSLALSWQLANGRCYGIFLLASSLAVHMLLRGEELEGSRPSLGFLAATFAVYAFVCGSHILGFLYAAGFIGMQVLLDIFGRRFRPTLYLSAALAFLVVIFSKGNLISTAALGKPSYWTVRPAIYNLLTLNLVFDQRLVTPLTFLFLLLLLHLRLHRGRRPVYVLTLGFAALDVLIFVYSRISTSIYVDRYLMPFSFIGILVLCELFTQLREADTYAPRLRAAIPAFFLLLAAGNFFLPSWQRPWLPFHNYTNGLLAHTTPGLPIVDTDVGSYVEVEFYHHDDPQHVLYFPVDWTSALDPTNIGGVSGYHEMDNFKTTGLYADGILPYQEIFDRYADFSVLTVGDPNAFFKHRILNNPSFTVSDNGVFEDGVESFHIWRVHRN